MHRLLKINEFFARHPLTRGRRLSAWARFASWQLRSRLRSEVIVPWICGQRLAARRGMAGATGNIYVGLHEYEDMLLTVHLLRAGDLMLDIGANVGSYTVLGAGVARATVWAFEPDPATMAHCRRNVELNQLEGRVVLHTLALGEEDGEVPFTIGNDTVNRIAEATDAHSRTVRMRTLDTMVGQSEPLLIKLDVEGAEERVLAGAGQTLARPGLKVVLIETVTETARRLLEGHGFRRRHYDPAARTLAPEPTTHAAANWLFVRDEEALHHRLRAAQAIDVLGRSI